MVLYEEQIRVGESEASLYISYFFEFWTVCMYYSFIKRKDRERERFRCTQYTLKRKEKAAMRGISEAVGRLVPRRKFSGWGHAFAQWACLASSTAEQAGPAPGCVWVKGSVTWQTCFPLFPPHPERPSCSPASTVPCRKVRSPKNNPQLQRPFQKLPAPHLGRSATKWGKACEEGKSAGTKV